VGRLGYEPAGFAAKYNLPIRITLTRLRGHGAAGPDPAVEH
jgi:hypothetical protein